MNKNKQAFTLVELIVVITVLAILGTIAFISLQGYSEFSRDSVRISDISNIKTSLELFNINSGKYPIPDGGEEVTYSGSQVWTQGTFGDMVFKNVEKLDKIPLDPLIEKEYVYSLLNTKNEYQIGAILEGEGVTQIELNNAYTAAPKKVKAYITGNYNGILAKVGIGQLTYVLAVPSIISSEVGDLQYIIDNNKLAYNGFMNLGKSYSGTVFDINGDPTLNLINIDNLIVYTGSVDLLNTNLKDQISILKNLQLSYIGTDIVNNSQIKEILEDVNIDLNNPTNKQKALAGNIINNIFELNIKTDKIYNTPYYEFRGITNNSNNVSINDIYNFNGNLYVVGGFVGNSNILGKDVIDSGSGSTFLAKLDNNGWAEWIKYSGGTSSDGGTHIFVNTNGEIYIGGKYHGPNNLFGNDISFLGNQAMYIAKFDSNGNNLWVKPGGGISSSYTRIEGIAANSAGEVYAIGEFTSTADIFGQSFTSAGQDDIFLVKLDTNGNNLWSKKAGGTSYEQFSSGGDTLTIDNSGNIYIGGVFTRTINLFGTSITNPFNSFNCYVAKLDSNGNSIWAKTITGSSAYSEYLMEIKLDNNGNIYTTGRFEGTANIFGTTLSSLGESDIYLSKLDNNGNNIWTKKAGGNDAYMSIDMGYSIDINNIGEIYFIGKIGNFDSNPVNIFGINITTPAWGQILAKIDSNGNAIWVKDLSSYYRERSKSRIALDINGNLYTSGNGYYGYSKISKFNSDGNIPD